jgi:hypothetical protein
MSIGVPKEASKCIEIVPSGYATAPKPGTQELGLTILATSGSLELKAVNNSSPVKNTASSRWLGSGAAGKKALAGWDTKP